MRHLSIVLAAVVASAVAAVPLPAQQTQPGDLKAQLEQAMKDRADVSKKLGELRDKIQKSPELADLRKAADEAAKAYNEKLGADPAVQAARKAQAEASKALNDLLAAKVAADPEGAELFKAARQANDKKLDQQFAMAQLDLQLRNPASPIQRKLRANPDWIKAEKDAGQDKQAQADLQKKREELLLAMPEAKDVTGKIEAARNGIKDLDASIGETGKKISSLRGKLQGGEDAQIAAARSKMQEANKALNEAQAGEEFQALKVKRDEANKAASEKTKELMDASPEVGPLNKQVEELSGRIAGLQQQIKQQAASAPAPKK